MHRLAWLLIPLSLAACGGKTPVPALSVACDGGTQLYGALSIDVPGDPVNGRPTLTYPDPTNPGKTGQIAVPAGGHCRITPQKST
ncbi:MAG TPA: hypothetical protein VFG12_15745 [Rhodopila sp.]|jgi:hypothetical protein|nr:hypothetical protein [Rhodopila sp.]